MKISCRPIADAASTPSSRPGGFATTRQEEPRLCLDSKLWKMIYAMFYPDSDVLASVAVTVRIRKSSGVEGARYAEVWFFEDMKHI
jgi:hypothetical protein